MKNICLLLFILLSTIQAYTQAPTTPDPAISEAMEAISFLQGEWEGKGWIQLGVEKQNFKQSEKIYARAGNTVLVIEGFGEDAKSKKTVHEAYAVISYDLTNKKYLMRAFKSDGKYIDAEANVTPDGSFEWGFSSAQTGQVKYTISLVDGKWVEKGEMKRGDANWFQFFETTLSKK